MDVNLDGIPIMFRQLVRALGPGGCMVTYGGMSQQPVQLSTASLIFNDVTLRGFWMSRWYEDENNFKVK
jgi:trans-2-enoyl-CoA reductase